MASKKVTFIWFMATILLAGAGCSSAVLVKDCKHKGSGIYECEKL